MQVIFDQHIGIFKNAISKDYCEKIIHSFESNKKYHLNRDQQRKLSNLYDEGVFPTRMEDLSIPTQVINQELRVEFCKTFMENIFPLYISKYKLQAIIQNPLYVDDFKVQKTSPTEGFHTWHAESVYNDDKVIRRLMVYTLYLNDIEEGGETEFLLQSKRVKPKQGTVCIFPAGYTHIHRGNPPLSGEKYITTGWISFEPIKQKINENS